MSQQFAIDQFLDCRRGWDLSSRTQLGRHERTVGLLSGILSKALGLDADFCHRIERSAALHDIGKVYINPEILNKQGPLSAEELRIVRQHPTAGYLHIQAIDRSGQLQLAAEIALDHHEHWNGHGYPFGKAGEEISLAGRIAAICDVYAALREQRPYKRGLSHAEAAAKIVAGSGTQFDPEIVQSFCTIEHLIEAALEVRLAAA
ncbi:MAG: HD domain-containing protein [Brevundimonas sp.]|nr:HD domain-containing protein [Brevundimonas sp.]